MRQEFKRIPEPLQKLIILRSGSSVLFLVLSVVSMIIIQDIYVLLPFIGVFVLCSASSISLFRRAVLGDYVIVSGECVEVGVTTIKHRVKFIILNTDICKLKVMLRGRRWTIKTGTTVKLYIAQNTPIYEDSDVHVLHTYLAIEMGVGD